MRDVQPYYKDVVNVKEWHTPQRWRHKAYHRCFNLITTSKPTVAYKYNGLFGCATSLLFRTCHVISTVASIT